MNEAAPQSEAGERNKKCSEREGGRKTEGKRDMHTWEAEIRREEVMEEKVTRH